MSTTHLIAIDADRLTEIEADPVQFVAILMIACRLSNPGEAVRDALRSFGTVHLTSSMDFRRAIEEAWRAYT
jgi:hypothetical protein